MAIPSYVLDDLQKWIADQRFLETASSAPIPMPLAIHDAALALHACIAPKIDAPTSDETDWISLLTRYKQAKFPRAKQDPLTYYDSQAEDSLPHAPKWHSFVTLEEVSRTFPDKAIGAPPPPSFAKKKEARQYASKCAVTWLMKERLMPSNGTDVKFPQQLKTVSLAAAEKPPVAKKQRTEDVLPPSPAGGAAVSVTTPPTNSSPGTTPAPSTAPPANSAAPKAKTVPTKSPFGDGGDCAVQKVTELCVKLKVQPPSYKITVENGRTETFEGYAEVDHSFLASVGELPRDWSRVSNVVGGKAWAKEQIAEKVLVVLEGLEAQRNAKLASLEKMMLGTVEPLS